ncbi:MAG: tRNA (N(6)-L-threonylcarbamoyladenosine(37)-C(2))-methylthiotransferase MtaB [Clostridia bacterium]|jgi:threonylcarbamoyladenosine tRNA methylthiotransferase MtaB|nr:tRNA (N(6)-L-threonylcarbamoyladenosine(37)-C(2))-methylthiotransferase MtaB [Clostridia bacterium]
MKKVAFYTLGCKVNQYETNGMIQKLMNRYEIVEPDKKADIYIVNTCSVTNMSDRKSRQMLRRAKEINSEALVIAVGCYAETAKEEIEKIPEVDLVLGNHQKANIAEYIEAYLEGKILNDEAIESYFYDFGTVTYTEKTRAVIKVQDGCNNFCSYCIIPYARGRICSRKPESVLREIKEIAENGIKEVVITGIQVSSYGKDFENNYKLIDLLEDINKIDGIERIRLGSLEPLIITDEFCDRLSGINKMCHHFHLSLQSGCDKTLKEMNRRYTTEQFEKVVERLRNLYNDVILTTDIIVGFPNETDNDFESTYEYLKKIKFYKTHVFKYSPRKGTVASKMKNQIPGDVKEERSKRLIELSTENQNEYLKDYIDKKVDVLFEEREDDFLKGHTANYIMVKSIQDDDKLNKIVTVNIKSFENEFLKDV